MYSCFKIVARAPSFIFSGERSLLCLLVFFTLDSGPRQGPYLTDSKGMLGNLGPDLKNHRESHIEAFHPIEPTAINKYVKLTIAVAIEIASLNNMKKGK